MAENTYDDDQEEIQEKRIFEIQNEGETKNGTICQCGGEIKTEIIYCPSKIVNQHAQYPTQRFKHFSDLLSKSF